MFPSRPRLLTSLPAILAFLLLLAGSARELPTPTASEARGLAEPRRLVLSPETLEAEAGSIFSGRVVALRTDRTPGGRAIFTEARVRTTNRIKGADAAEQLIRVPGGELGDEGVFVSHQPEFFVG